MDAQGRRQEHSGCDASHGVGATWKRCQAQGKLTQRCYLEMQSPLTACCGRKYTQRLGGKLFNI